MKKLLLTLSIILSATMIFAQKSNVSKADRLTKQDNPNFTEARSAIKAAIENEDTKNEAKTYYIAGMIGYKQNEDCVTKMFTKQNVSPDTKGEAIMESYKYFMDCNKIDQTPNKKGKIKPKYSKRIKNNLKEYFSQQYNLIAYGAYLFENKKYDKALNVFETYLEIPKLPLFEENELSTTDSTYRMIKYFTAISATNAKKSEKAIALYTDLLDDNYEQKNCYQLLAEEYKNMKDTANQIAILKKGAELYQNDPWFLQNIINIFISTGKEKDAATYLDDAIAKSPSVPEYYYVKGNIQERLGNYDISKKAFEKALELKPDMAESYAGLGRVIYNEAVEVIKQADSIKDNKLYNEKVEEALAIFRKAEPYMEKAVELNPDDMDFKKALKTLYYRLEEHEKYDALSKEMGE